MSPQRRTVSRPGESARIGTVGRCAETSRAERPESVGTTSASSSSSRAASQAAVGDRVGRVAAGAAHAVSFQRVVGRLALGLRGDRGHHRDRLDRVARRPPSPARASPRRCRRGSRWRRRRPRRASGATRRTIESSICVAVIDGPRERAGQREQPLLDDRHLLDRQLDAEVAARDHDAVGRARGSPRARSTACGFSIFAISGMRVCSRTRVDVLGPAHEAQRDDVDADRAPRRAGAPGPPRGPTGSSRPRPGC